MPVKNPTRPKKKNSLPKTSPAEPAFMNISAINVTNLVRVAVVCAIIFSIGGYLLGRRMASQNNNQNQNPITPTDDIIFQKSESWGKTPNGDCSENPSACSQTTTVYTDGRLIYDGYNRRQKALSSQTLEQIKTTISQQNILDKQCDAPVVMDYSATYYVNLNGKKRTVQYPGCEQEFNLIERLLPE
ncbi:hypothetical protein HGA91_05065 [candidate division WWE3 bacterium]|nr:hypothetical protein [candidate division WWE3 bacterium]